MDHINNGPYQLLKKDPTIKVKTKTLKELKFLKDNEFTDNKLYYYLKPNDSPTSRFYGQPKIQEFLYVLLFHIAVPRCTIVTNT